MHMGRKEGFMRVEKDGAEEVLTDINEILHGELDLTTEDVTSFTSPEFAKRFMGPVSGVNIRSKLADIICTRCKTVFGGVDLSYGLPVCDATYCAECYVVAKTAKVMGAGNV